MPWTPAGVGSVVAKLQHFYLLSGSGMSRQAELTSLTLVPLRQLVVCPSVERTGRWEPSKSARLGGPGAVPWRRTNRSRASANCLIQAASLTFNTNGGRVMKVR